MAFVREKMSEENKQKYDRLYWTVDRKRGVFLIASEIGRENERTFELYNLNDGKFILRARAKDKSSGNPKDGILEWYEIYNLFIVEAMRSEENKLVNVLTDALNEYGLKEYAQGNLKNCTVKVTFPNHKFGGTK
ncbi:MAG: hypothetical protein A2887_02260 [Alphaproteobacteria bacterium RIFCSPLOWO2_01_FULL_40_26]|nr:MAG: hypothetical protein A3D15_03030 [Alphaproteobacteria bacterium RIFCSPHIGHO2_02_FULL_40_34]OFW94813.1 MAG: hypothetical protein A2887_02260 [Alphaproteobacteria bacterium RIFCSPLOWO2_01_FULL_40_26]OFX10439.1 MAG: hypothetical protein A3H30_03670 [Alphaproteobacteria bacterium RIFCSPLOWO2_02_FULL_40_19]OFX11013.1 MAG: hypothetical protein A3G22_01120 [Alphaproteobacteria bacterium RIFCSPLOWO2_12_FULL_40_11]